MKRISLNVKRLNVTKHRKFRMSNNKDLILTDEQAFRAYPQYRWVYNKFDLALKLGYDCGVDGETVSKDGVYIIRPIINFQGMSRDVYVERLKAGQIVNCDPDSFWCEKFQGDHISVDYIDGEFSYAVHGLKNSTGDFTEWTKISDKNYEYAFDGQSISVPTLPKSVRAIAKKVKHFNAEFVDGHLIECHLRPNPDFRGHNFDRLRVVNVYGVCEPKDGETYLHRPDGFRKGFWASNFEINKGN